MNRLVVQATLVCAAALSTAQPAFAQSAPPGAVTDMVRSCAAYLRPALEDARNHEETGWVYEDSGRIHRRLSDAEIRNNFAQVVAIYAVNPHSRSIAPLKTMREFARTGPGGRFYLCAMERRLAQPAGGPQAHHGMSSHQSNKSGGPATKRLKHKIEP